MTEGFFLINTATGLRIVWSDDEVHITALAEDFNTHMAGDYAVVPATN